MIRNKTRVNSCPTDLNNFSSHAFVGRKVVDIYGWDLSQYTISLPGDVIDLEINSGVGSNTTSIAATDITDLMNQVVSFYNSFMAGAGGVSTIVGTLKGGMFYFEQIGGNTDVVQLSLFNSTTSSWLSSDGTFDSDNDGVTGEFPYYFSVIDESQRCELIPVIDQAFDCTKDEVLFVKAGITETFNGTFLGMSYPEGVNWANVIAYDNRSWEMTIFIDTDLITPATYTIPAATYTSFPDMINALNIKLATHGSNFRLKGITNNRILVADVTNTALDSASPYFTLNNFGDIVIVIEDSVTHSDWLVKSAGCKNVSLTNITYTTPGAPGLFKGNPGCGGSIALPVPILALGANYTLQHTRGSKISTLMDDVQTSSNTIVGGTVTQTGDIWANGPVNVAVSMPDADYAAIKNNKPMIFLEVLAQVARSNKKGKIKKPQWIHPQNIAGPLNRLNSNYSTGSIGYMTTEWDLTTDDFKDQIVEIDPKTLYLNPPTLPLPWVDFVLNGYNLRYQRRTSPITTPGGNRVVNTFKQPIRFRFAYIDPVDNRSVRLGPPSEELYIQPKWGYFNDNVDTYVYDWTIRFNR